MNQESDEEAAKMVLATDSSKKRVKIVENYEPSKNGSKIDYPFPSKKVTDTVKLN